MKITENGKRKTENPEADRPREKCGIFGIYGHPDAARLTYFGLYALQHRGQESCGIVTGDGCRVRQHRGLGLVSEVFNSQVLEQLPGHLAIGHVRYSTTGSTLLVNAQPFVVQHGGQSLAIGHNGTLTNAREIRRSLEEGGSIFQSTMDTEVIVHLMARHRGKDAVESLINALDHVRGSYSLVLATADQVIAARDPHGFRPLEPGAAERRLGGRVRNLRPGPGAGRLLAGSGARRNRGPGRETASTPISPSRLRPPFLHLRVHLFRPPRQPDLRPAASIWCASAWARLWPGSTPCKPTWSCPSRIPACTRPWATLAPPASPLKWG